MSRLFIRDEEGRYRPSEASYSHEQLVSFAKKLTAYRFRRKATIENPQGIRDYLELHFGELQREKFWVAFLDNRHRVIEHEILFEGTIDASSVYPRVVVQRALQHNAAAVILAHNHPSGVAEPSRADSEITKKLKEALTLIEVRILDHMIVGDGYTVSLAERREL